MTASPPVAEVLAEHGFCPKCGANLDGGLIWDTGLAMALAGTLFKQRGDRAPTRADAEMMADDYAQSYGTTRTKGQWDRAILHKILDGADFYQCPDCQHEWPASALRAAATKARLGK